MTVATEEDFTLRCQHQHAASIVWLFNDSRRIPDQVHSNQSSSAGEFRLRITQIPIEYNGTTIRCMANLYSGQEEKSDSAVLLLQG